MAPDGFDVGCERGPVEKVVGAGNGKPGIVERERSIDNDGILDEFRTPFDLLIEKIRVLAMKEVNGRGIGSAMGSEKSFCLLLVGGKR